MIKPFFYKDSNMHKHKKFRHGHRPKPFHGFFWVFIFMMIFSKGDWWPGILVLIGLSIVFGSFFQDETKPAEAKNPSSPTFIPTPPPVAPKPVPAPVESIHRADLLPITCAQCGGFVRSYEVKWTGAQSAVCPYCGSNLTMKKR